MIQLDTAYRVSAFLLLVVDRQDRNSHYDVYWEDRDDCDPVLEDTFLVVTPVEGQGDAMVSPEAMQQRGWWLYCSDELVRDVVDFAAAQKPTLTAEELLRSLVHYMHEDCFLDLAGSPPA